MVLSCFDRNDFILEALSDIQPDSSPEPISCNVFPLVLSSFKDQQCSVDIDPSAQPSVRGRLRKCIDVIIQGCKIPFFHLPTPFSKANNASARTNSTFMTETVNNLLKLNPLSQKFFALRTLLIRSLFLLVVRVNKG